MDQRGTRLEIPERLAAVLPRGLMAATLALALLVPAGLSLVFNRVDAASVPSHDEDRFRSVLEACRLAHGRVFLRGWAHVEGELGVSGIQVHLVSRDGSALRIPSRVERREDVAAASGRPREHDALFDGFSAGSARLGDAIVPPATVILTRVDRHGRLRGARHVCR